MKVFKIRCAIISDIDGDPVWKDTYVIKAETKDEACRKAFKSMGDRPEFSMRILPIKEIYAIEEVAE